MHRSQSEVSNSIASTRPGTRSTQCAARNLCMKGNARETQERDEKQVEARGLKCFNAVAFLYNGHWTHHGDPLLGTEWNTEEAFQVHTEGRSEASRSSAVSLASR
eukprot:2474966-Amphidinium_carterae.1